MIPTTSFLDRLTQETGPLLNGIWRLIDSIEITEIVGTSGYDFQIFDREHGTFGFPELQRSIVAADLHGCLAFVRVGGLDPVEAQRALDLGAAGLVFPQLKSRADFEKALRLLHYPPEGERGFNPFTRSGGFGARTPQPVGNPICFPILETLAAVKDLDAILELENIPLFYIGAYDLSAQIGRRGEMDHPELLALMETVVGKIRAAGRAAAVMVKDKAQRDFYLRLGARVHVHTVDTGVFRAALEGRLAS